MEKKKMTNKKKFWIGMSSLAAIGAITATVAYFQMNKAFENNLKNKSTGVTIEHALNQQKAQSMLPGQTENLDIKVSNTGETPVLARIKYVNLGASDNIYSTPVDTLKSRPGIEVTKADRDFVFNAVADSGFDFNTEDGYYYYTGLINGSGNVQHIDNVTFKSSYVSTSDNAQFLIEGQEEWANNPGSDSSKIVGTKYIAGIDSSQNIAAVVEVIQATDEAGNVLTDSLGSAGAVKTAWEKLAPAAT